MLKQDANNKRTSRGWVETPVIGLMISWPNGNASGRNLNLPTDLCWVAKQTRKSSRKCTQFVKISHLRVSVSKNRRRFEKCGHGQKIDFARSYFVSLKA